MNRLLSLFLILSIAACSPQEQPAAPSTPVADDASGWSLGAMASAANPYAVDAAIKMLEKGGHAVDAAIAAHAVLGLVEPQSSGIGGSGFMLVFERDDKKQRLLPPPSTCSCATARQ
jgi:gamma-glutamyltranspeptidase/glutathione hydrolase